MSNIHQALMKDICPPCNWVNERLIGDSEVYLFELSFTCSYTTTFWTYRKSSNSIPCSYKSTTWQRACCNVLIPSDSIKELHDLSFLTAGVFGSLWFPSWMIIAFLYQGTWWHVFFNLPHVFYSIIIIIIIICLGFNKTRQKSRQRQFTPAAVCK